MCRMYKSSTATSLDYVHVRTLLTVNKPEPNPPTSDAAKYHIRRAFLQASRWCNAFSPIHGNLVSPVACGGFNLEGDQLVPIMMSKHPIPDAVLAVVTCDCRSDCNTNRCGCRKAKLKCTLVCHKGQQYSQEQCKNLVRDA